MIPLYDVLKSNPNHRDRMQNGGFQGLRKKGMENCLKSREL